MLSLAVIVVQSGCRAEQLRTDQFEMRQALLRLYMDQIMDNLIRIRNDLPIIQLDYTQMTGTVTDQVNAGGGWNQSNTANRFAEGVTPTGSTRVLVNSYSVTSTGQQINQLTITANPVTNNNDVYDAYLEFLQDKDRLQVTASPPGKLEAHIVREYEGQYYWIPKSAASAFFRLSLVTTAQRGQATIRPTAFEGTIVGVVETTPINATAARYRLRLTSKVPNDSGRLTTVVNGHEYSFSLQLLGPIDGSPVPANKRTEFADLIYDEQDPDGPKLPRDEFVKAIEGKAVKIRLENNVPGYVKTDDLLDNIHHQLELQRLNGLVR
jgi:hypothetical protein